MFLIHPKIIERNIKAFSICPTEHLDILTRWANNLKTGLHGGEMTSDSEFIQKIFVGVLGYTTHGSGETWSLEKNKSVGKGNVDVALGEFSLNHSKIIAPCELKGARTRDLDAVMPGRNKTPVQQAWEYGIDIKGARWVIVSNYREIRLYAMGYGRQEYESFDLTRAYEPHEYARLMLIHSAKQLMDGNTFKLLSDSEDSKQDITRAFYQKYSLLRDKLILELTEHNSIDDRLKSVTYAQTILDRVIFIIFAESKNLLPPNTLRKILNAGDGYSPKPL